MPAPAPRQLPEPFFRFEESTTRRTSRRARLGLIEDLNEAAEEANRRRHLDCAHYDGCLDMASRAGWRGFDCYGCEAYKADDGFMQEERLAAMRMKE